jgi:hypothetical protein
MSADSTEVQGHTTDDVTVEPCGSKFGIVWWNGNSGVLISGPYPSQTQAQQALDEMAVVDMEGASWDKIMEDAT